MARSLVRVDRDAGEAESLVSDVVVWAREQGRFIDAEMVGDLALLRSSLLSPGSLARVRARLEHVLMTEVPEGATVRLTCGWEDDGIVVRLLARSGDEESLWEWGIGDE